MCTCKPIRRKTSELMMNEKYSQKDQRAIRVRAVMPIRVPALPRVIPAATVAMTRETCRD